MEGRNVRGKRIGKERSSRNGWRWWGASLSLSFFLYLCQSPSPSVFFFVSCLFTSLSVNFVCLVSHVFTSPSLLSVCLSVCLSLSLFLSVPFLLFFLASFPHLLSLPLLSFFFFPLSRFFSLAFSSSRLLHVYYLLLCFSPFKKHFF